MKINQPVTQREVPMKDGTILVSKTDLKGRITFCNDEFVQISGFSERELIGASHNIVRHPDMPPAAFADLWDTLKRGEPWYGLVKNRARNGDHYWVYANVTPIVENGKVTGYMSVRTKPAARQIEDAEKQYRRLWEQQKQNDRTPAGQPSRATGDKPGLRGRFAEPLLPAIFLQLGALLSFLGDAPMAATTALMLLAPAAAMLMQQRERRRARRYHERISTTLDDLMEGRFFNWITPGEDGDLGRIMRQLRMIQIKLGFDVVDANETVLKLLNLVTRLDNLAQRFQDSAASMEESAANITEINSLVKNNSDNAIDANRMASHAVTQVEKSRDALDRAVEAMTTIDNSTTKIADIIGVIDEIAFKTNLLALNAAVEAAHAGDQGKGFAVVADEVRTLSQLTTSAASEVKQLIQDNIAKVKDGAEMIGLSSDALRDVVAEVENVSQLISEISVSGKEQAIGIEMLSDNIQTINDTLQHSSHMIHEASAQSEQIGERAEEYVEKTRIRTAA